MKPMLHAIATALMIAGASIVSSPPARAQTTPPTPTQQQAQVDAVLAGFHEVAWNKRAASVRRLEYLINRDPELLNSPPVYDAMVALVQMESAIILQNYRQKIDTSEGFGGYYDELLGLATRFLPTGTPDTRQALLAALVHGIYNPDSRLAKGLALYGEAVIKPALALTRHDLEPQRWNAYAMLGEILRADKARELKVPLAPGSAARLRVALRGGLQDPDIVTRRETIGAIVAAGDREAIPLLMLLAANDPDSGAGKTQWFAVRALAADAVTKLQQAR